MQWIKTSVYREDTIVISWLRNTFPIYTFGFVRHLCFRSYQIYMIHMPIFFRGNLLLEPGQCWECPMSLKYYWIMSISTKPQYNHRTTHELRACYLDMLDMSIRSNYILTSSNGNIFRFTAQKPVTRSFDVFDLRLNKRLSKQWWSWWFETPSRPLWRHCYVYSSLRWISNFEIQSDNHQCC